MMESLWKALWYSLAICGGIGAVFGACIGVREAAIAAGEALDNMVLGAGLVVGGAVFTLVFLWIWWGMKAGHLK